MPSECIDEKPEFAYVLTEGAYSDYHIVAVYLDKGLAEEAAERLGANVEEYPIDSRRPVLFHWYQVEVAQNGQELYRQEWEAWSIVPVPTDPEPTFNYSSEQAVGASTRGYDVALKIARDRQTREQAVREGIA